MRGRENVEIIAITDIITIFLHARNGLYDHLNQIILWIR